MLSSQYSDIGSLSSCELGNLYALKWEQLITVLFFGVRRVHKELRDKYVT